MRIFYALVIITTLLYYSPSAKSMEKQHEKVDEEGNTQLIIACRDGNIDLAKELIKEHSQLDSCNKQGKTALMVACQRGHNKLVKLLLSKNANLDIQDREGKTAYQLAKAEALKLPDNKQYQKILGMLRSASLMHIATNPTVLILSAAAITSLITQGSRYFQQRSFTYPDPLYHLFYFNALTEPQKKEYESLLLHSPNPILLLHNDQFIKTLSADQRLELLYVIRKYHQEKGPMHQSTSTSLSFSKLPAFKKAQQMALAAFQTPSKKFEKGILETFFLRAHSLKGVPGRFACPEGPLVSYKDTYVLDEHTTAFCFSSDHKTYAAALTKKCIVILNTINGLCIGLIPLISRTKISRITFDGARTMMAASSAVGEVLIISVDLQEIQLSFDYNPTGSITSISFNKDSTLLALATSQGEITVWNTTAGKTVFSDVLPGVINISQVIFKTDHLLTILSNGNKEIGDYAIDENRLIMVSPYQNPSLPLFGSEQALISINKSGTHLIFLSKLGTITVADSASGHTVCSFLCKLDQPTSIEYG